MGTMLFIRTAQVEMYAVDIQLDLSTTPAQWKFSFRIRQKRGKHIEPLKVSGPMTQRLLKEIDDWLHHAVIKQQVNFVQPIPVAELLSREVDRDILYMVGRALIEYYRLA